jgi:hypothetical protein
LSATHVEHPENLPAAAELFAARRRALRQTTIKSSGR